MEFFEYSLGFINKINLIMLLIQIILVAIIITIIFYSILRFKNDDLDSKRLFFWIIFWLVAIMVIIWPNFTVLIANYVGIGRGVDLIVYGSLIFIFYSLFRLLIRIEKLEKNLTQLVRQKSIDDYNEKQ